MTNQPPPFEEGNFLTPDKLAPLQTPSASETPHEESETTNLKEATAVENPTAPNEVLIAGFWRRMTAVFMDIVTLAIPLMILGRIFLNTSFALGPWGRFIGCGLFIWYTGYYNSEKRGGQTLGKLLLGIKVVDEQGAPLSLRRSVGRAFLLAPLFLLSGLNQFILSHPIITFFGMVIVWGESASLLYSLAFNRTTRQGVHDLWAGSYVVQTAVHSPVVMPAFPVVHRAFTYQLLGIGLLCGLLSIASQKGLVYFGILEQGEMQNMVQLQTILMADHEFFSVGVQRTNTIQLTGRSNHSPIQLLSITIWAKTSCQSKPDYCTALIDLVAQTTLTNYPSLDGLSGVSVTILNQFDFAFANGNYYQTETRSIEDWREILQMPANGG